jgi:UDP-N-acetylmuramate dehydrogenase
MSGSEASTNVPLAHLTTLGVGGAARFYIEAHTEKDIEDAITFARHHRLPLLTLGKGSNILVPDAGIEGVVLKISLRDIKIEEDGDDTLFIAGAGALWEDVVDEAVARGLFGIENLAGIPGSVGGAAVQNIGAYGAELADTFEYADSIDRMTGIKRRITKADAALAYRSSIFKENRAHIITRVALRLTKRAMPNIAYADLERARTEGTPLSTPLEIARAVRSIRALKFPQNRGEGTAGSFFKNPVVDEKTLVRLRAQYPGLPVYPVSTSGGKISLAWLLDHALSLKGFSLGAARLYEKQPLIIVARAGARASEVDELADLVAERVFAATGIRIEREVEMFGARG